MKRSKFALYAFGVLLMVTNFGSESSAATATGDCWKAFTKGNYGYHAGHIIISAIVTYDISGRNRVTVQSTKIAARATNNFGTRGRGSSFSATIGAEGKRDEFRRPSMTMDRTETTFSRTRFDYPRGTSMHLSGKVDIAGADDASCDFFIALN